MTLSESIFLAAVHQAKAHRDRVLAQAYAPKELTPIVRDMQRTARELGIVAVLLEHQRKVLDQPAIAYDLVESALLALGVSNGELLDNLKRED